MTGALVFPMAVHVAFTAVLYALLTVVRAPSIWGLGRAADGSNPCATLERRIRGNLSNQFEWPLFFHAACLLLLQLHAIDRVQVVLAWIFIAGRFVHSCVQIGTTNVRLRGVVFMINFVAVLGMWARLVADASVSG
jgi:hypothetical protein